jgi:hypothetical protein
VLKVSGCSAPAEPEVITSDENHVVLFPSPQDEGLIPQHDPQSASVPAIDLNGSSSLGILEDINIFAADDGHTTSEPARSGPPKRGANKRTPTINGWGLRRPRNPPRARLHPMSKSSSLVRFESRLVPVAPAFTTALCLPPMRMEQAESCLPTPAPSPPSTLGPNCGIPPSKNAEVAITSHAREATTRESPSMSAAEQSPGNGAPEQVPEQAREPPRPPKRSNPDRDPFEEGNGSNRKSRRMESAPPFACPMFKHDPIANSHCGSFRLTRIKDVKQHIIRIHCRPYCPRCYATFAKDAQRDEHARSGAPCESVDRVPENWGNLTGQQKSRLQARFDRDTSEKHWFQIWDILFPGCDRPKSPYLFSPVEETMSLVRDFWDREQDRIIRDVLHDREDAWPTNHVVVADVVNEVLKRFQDMQLGTASGSRRSPSSEQGPGTPPPPSLADGQGMDILDWEIGHSFGGWMTERIDTLDSGYGEVDDLDLDQFAGLTNVVG